MGIETYATPTSGGATAVGASPTAAPRKTVPAPPRPRSGQGASGLFATAPASAPRMDTGPEPRLRQLIAVCIWAAIIGGVALVIGIRALIGSLADDPASWYQPWIIAVGLAALSSTVAAFVTVNRRWVPFALLGVSTALVVVSLILTANAF